MINNEYYINSYLPKREMKSGYTGYGKFKLFNEVNKIYCGDCLEVMPNIPDKSIDMILCDLPYGTTACKWDIVIPFELLWKQYKRIIKDNGAIVLFGSEPFSSYLRLSNIKNYKYDWIWDKVAGANFMNLKNRPFKTHENILIFSKNSNFTFNPIKVPRTEKSIRRQPIGKERVIKGEGEVEFYNLKRINVHLIGGLKHPIDIIRFSIHEKGRYNFRHPTKKPVALFEYLIKTYTNEGDLVLDNCAGSGTTGVACKNLGRNYILIEKDREYCDIAEDRIRAVPELLF